MRLATTLLSTVVLLATTPTVSLAADDLTFKNGFADLFDRLGPSVMGRPLEPEHPDRDDPGDIVQLTSTGLARYRVGVMPAFFNGETRFMWSADKGVESWLGDSWLPPVPARMPVEAPSVTVSPSGRGAGYSLSVRVTYYTLSGKMRNGAYVHHGAAACSSNIPMGSVVVFKDGLRVVCEDTGLLGASGWIDVWGDTGVVSRYGDRTTVQVFGP